MLRTLSDIVNPNCYHHHHYHLEKLLFSQIKAVACILQQTFRLTSFLFLQLDGLGRVPDGVVGEANERLAKITLSDFFQVDNTLNDFICEGGFNTRKGGEILHQFSIYKLTPTCRNACKQSTIWLSGELWDQTVKGDTRRI